MLHKFYFLKAPLLYLQTLSLVKKGLKRITQALKSSSPVITAWYYNFLAEDPGSSQIRSATVFLHI